jgi:dienelactone hydrolase
VAPAGTNLLSGANLAPLNDEAYHDETLPYAQAGMVAILYSIDGEDPEQAKDEAGQNKEMMTAYQAFNAAGAGTVNGRNALEFALARLPMVDPERIFSAGHSSAATLSLLLAAHEPRLRGCIAYAPAIDLETHFADLLASPQTSAVLPGFAQFAKRSSPLTHAGRIRMPVFLFFADDDGMIPTGSYLPFVNKLKETNPRLTLQTVSSGGHYRSMIREGLPAGIDWIRSGSQ